MERSTSQKIIRILGILIVIGAVLCFIGGIALLGLGGIGATVVQETEKEAVLGVGVALVIGVILIVSGIVDLIEGIFALRASNDATKARPLWIISLIAVILSVISLVAGLINGADDILSSVYSAAMNIGIFFLANNIKNEGQEL